MHTTSTLSYVLDEVVSTVAFGSFYGLPYMTPMLATVRGTNKRRERSASFGELGDYEEKPEGIAPAEDSISQQFEKDLVQAAYSKKIKATREVVMFDEWGVVAQIGEQLGTKGGETMEKKGAAVFNDAFAGATYKTEDGLSICSGAHVNSDGGNSQDNSGTNTFNWAGVEATRLAMFGYKNYRGDLSPVIMDAVILPPALQMTGWELTKSALKPDTANNNINVYQNGFEAYVWPWLTDTNNWFGINKALLKRNFVWLQAVALEIFGDGNLEVGYRNMCGFYMCACGMRDWRGIYGNVVP